MCQTLKLTEQLFNCFFCFSYDNYLNHNYSQREAALLKKPNYANPDSMMSNTESDRMSTSTDQYSDTMYTTPAMPILPDMPTRSRKLIEDLGSSPIGPGNYHNPNT